MPRILLNRGRGALRARLRYAFRPLNRFSSDAEDSATPPGATARERWQVAACSPANTVVPMVGGNRERHHAGVRHKRTADYAAELWTRWPQCEDWPGKLDLYEAAAYLRVDYKTIWRACQIAQDGKARLPHQRIGTTYRINRADLDAFGAVQGR